MDPESQKLLERTFELTEENNKMLHKVRGVQKRDFLWSVVKYTIIIGIMLGSFYYLEPYINQIKNAYGNASDVLNSFGQ